MATAPGLFQDESSAFVIHSWSASQLIETNDTGTAQLPQVGLDDSGNAIALWQQSDNTGEYNILSNRYVAGTSWENAQIIWNGDAYEPQIDVGPSGAAVAVWSASVVVRWDIRSCQYE